MKRKKIFGVLLAGMVFCSAFAFGGCGTDSSTVSAASDTPTAAQSAVETTAVQDDAVTGRFADVSSSNWFAGVVEDVVKRGVMQGVADGQFAPDMEFSRAMMAQVLYNMEGQPAVQSAAGYRDVKAGDWFADAVSWASENNIVNGLPQGQFAPDQSISREQAVTMLYRYSLYKGYGAEQGLASGKEKIRDFEDAATVSEYAKDAITWGIGESILEGMDEHQLAPSKGMTRAMAAAVLSRAEKSASWFSAKLESASLQELIAMAPEVDGWYAEDLFTKLKDAYLKDPESFRQAVDASSLSEKQKESVYFHVDAEIEVVASDLLSRVPTADGEAAEDLFNELTELFLGDPERVLQEIDKSSLTTEQKDSVYYEIAANMKIAEKTEKDMQAFQEARSKATGTHKAVLDKMQETYETFK